ncbi:MAG: spore coat protein [Defluviitaleaceae bacterium]|nr:spore coat protein [Defluviitaleaceae bacterium]MCL2836647.1 spore coat protein [Defluviitaleaceae bacterium]
MHEKDMVSDILSGTKASLASYAKVIVECNDQNLRQTFQQMRDSDEKFQYDLYKIAASKGYYHPAPPANQQDVSGLKNILHETSRF